MAGTWSDTYSDIYGTPGQMINVSGVVTDEVKNAYLGTRLVVTRSMVIYESDAVTVWNKIDLRQRLISGSISVDSSRDERRTFDMILDNKDRVLIHDPNGGFWYDKIIKVYRGLLYYSDSGVRRHFECQIGEFMIDNINSDRFPNHLAISGRDYTKKLLLDMFAVDTAFQASSRVDDVVRTVATNGGIVKFRLNAEGATIGTTATFARNSSRWENLKTMCEGLNIEIYFDREGYLVTRRYEDVSNAAPYYSLTTEQALANIVNFSKSSSDSNIFNHIVVTGTSEEETVTGYKYISIRQNTDTNSPTNIVRLGRRTFPFEVDYLTSQAQADQLCNRLYSVKQLEDFTLSFSSVCIPWLEVGRVLSFDDPDDNNFTVPTRYLFSSFAIPLSLGPMTGEGKRIVIIGQDLASETVLDNAPNKDITLLDIANAYPGGTLADIAADYPTLLHIAVGNFV